MIRKYWYERVDVKKHHGVPHWQVPGGVYFLTWRLAGSIPREQEEALGKLRDELSRIRELGFPDRSIEEAEREYFRLLDSSLDCGSGEAFMLNPAIADLVDSALRYGDGQTHELIAYSVMPNHVHVVFRLHEQLDELVQRWKSFTAHAANKILGRKGTFWAEATLTC